MYQGRLPIVSPTTVLFGATLQRSQKRLGALIVGVRLQRLLVQGHRLRVVLPILLLQGSAEQHHRLELIGPLRTNGLPLFKAPLHRRQLESRIQFAAQLPKQLQHPVGLPRHGRGVLQLRRFGVDRPHIHAHRVLWIDHEAPHEHVQCTQRLANLGRRFLLHPSTGTEVLFLEQRLQAVALHHPDIVVARKLGDEHLRQALAERGIIGIVADRAVREVHDGHGGLGGRSLGSSRPSHTDQGPGENGRASQRREQGTARTASERSGRHAGILPEISFEENIPPNSVFVQYHPLHDPSPPHFFRPGRLRPQVLRTTLMPKVCPVCGSSYPDTNVFCPADGSTLRAADADGDLIGSVVADRYLVTDLLGEGGMGKVYLARHVRLPLQAAIKVLRPELMKDPASVARFNREAANASSIEHERVARVFDFGETAEGLVYLAMEYVNGSTLKNVLAKDGPLSAQRTAVIVRQVADGLDAAHRMGIVHRDLKPDNILVQQDDQGVDKCKVVDFGIAKAVGSDEKEAGLTRTGFVVGTPEFMSPEQLLGSPIDHRSDVYALALVAYQCLTLDLPFDGNTPDRGMTARLVAEPRALGLVRPDIQWPAGLQQVFTQALERDPAKRTSSAGAFAKALEAALLAPARPTVSAAPASDSADLPGGTTPRPTPPAAPTQGNTPGAARVIETVDKEQLRRELDKSGARPRSPTPSASRTPPRALPQQPAPQQPAPRVDVQAAPRRRVSVSRIPLPSLSLLLVIGAGWWWYTKQRAPRASDIDRLVNSATNTAGRLVEEAQGAASAVTSTVTDAARSTSGTGTTATGTPESQAAAAPAGATPAGATPATANATPNKATASPASPASSTPSTTTGTPAATRALATLDSITKALDPASADENAARAAIPVLQSIIARLPTGTDSTWAYIRIAEAHLLMDEVRPACTALRAARTSARSMAQAEVINRYTGQLGCTQ